jgi:ubiquinone/menaquinone biosynthesis C-methylase UbiE
MARDHQHATQERLANYQTRTLESTCSALKRYLRAGARTLDVGCSVGSITLEVARLVAPARVHGVDLEPKAVDKAKELASRSDVTNATFSVRTGSSLSFDDETFDITYSLNLFAWVPDPVAELREHARVTKRGGTVIAANTADLCSLHFHPPCPGLTKFLLAWATLRESQDPTMFHDPNPGSRYFETFSGAELRRIGVHSYVDDAAYPLYGDRQRIQRVADKLLERVDLKWSSPEAAEHLRRSGLIDDIMLDQARREIQQWAAHPYAFVAYLGFIATGVVP